MILDNALSWTVLHAIWQGTLAALILSVALWFLRSPGVRYAAACIALAVTLAGFVITLIHLMPDRTVIVPASSLHGVPPGTNSARFALARVAPSIALPRWIAPLWFLGVVLFQLRALGGWVGVWRLRRTGVCAASSRWQARLSELASSLRVTKPVVLLQSSLAGVPVVIGHLRPVILMPLGLLTSLPCEQIETILMHELAHIRRRDYLINLVQTVAEGLLFYHPAVWWISGVIRTERENCCDDLVVATSGDPHQYALALTALAENRWSGHDITLAATGGSLVKRIRRLLREPEGPRASLLPLVTASLLLVTFGVALVAYQSKERNRPEAALPAVALPVAPASALPVRLLAQARVQQNTPSPATSGKTPDAPWTKWLKEDVAYIVTDEERNAFRGLHTDEERAQFVEQFWLRRDPTPGTPENEFKEEHYRRIGYVNQRFSDPSGLAGWKTDRGRIYITFGPPDEIDSHPSGGKTSAYPFEDWRYRYIKGIGRDVNIEFVDKTMTGEYHMTRDPNEKDPLLNRQQDLSPAPGPARRAGP